MLFLFFIPSLCSQADELHELSDKVRRNKEKYSKKERELREANEELDRAQKLLKKMKGLVEDKQLAERDDLQRKLLRAEKELSERETTIRVRYSNKSV